MSEEQKLGSLPPGTMFKRVGGKYRYVKSTSTIGWSGNEIFCYNLDGESTGYYHNGNERVIAIAPCYPRVEEVASPEPCEKHTPAKAPARFWVCWVDGGGIPSYQHSNVDRAYAEAERLAKRTGRRVFVLVAVHSVTHTSPVPHTEYSWEQTRG